MLKKLKIHGSRKHRAHSRHSEMLHSQQTDMSIGIFISIHPPWRSVTLQLNIGQQLTSFNRISPNICSSLLAISSITYVLTFPLFSVFPVFTGNQLSPKYNQSADPRSNNSLLFPFLLILLSCGCYVTNLKGANNLPSCFLSVPVRPHCVAVQLLTMSEKYELDATAFAARRLNV